MQKPFGAAASSAIVPYGRRSPAEVHPHAIVQRAHTVDTGDQCAKVFSGTYVTDDSVLTAMEVPLRVLTAGGFSLPDAVRGWGRAYSYVIGFTIEEQAVRPLAGERDPRYDVDSRARRIDPDRFPLTYQAGGVQFDDFEGRSRHGLRVIIAGLEQLSGTS
jgi:TetR/AcrR family transcriptional regulator, tetracycline repressor protein